MKTVISAAALLAASVALAVCPAPPHSEKMHFAFECRDVAKEASAYLSSRGALTFEKVRLQDIEIVGRGAKHWTDANGKEITDFRVYWTFANRGTGQKLPIGVWHIRMEHYQPLGKFNLASDERECNANFQLAFQTSGGMVMGILPVDDQWSYDNNGRMEREYLSGISAALEQRKASPR